MKFHAACLLAALGLGAVPAQAATMYCCNDGNGHKACGDVLPEACYGRAYRISDERGTRNVEAPLTAEQKVQRAAEAKRKQDEERVALDERRRNAALLNTYASIDDIDFMRDRALHAVERELAQAQARYDEIAARKRQLAAQVGNNAADSGNLLADFRSADAELKGQQRVIESKRQEMVSVRARFEAEKKRYLELSQGGGKAAPAPGTEAKPRP
jgi:hypothetical protein